MSKTHLTTREVAIRLGVCHQRVWSLFKAGNFPNAHYCECGHTIVIPPEDLKAEIKRRGSRNAGLD